MICRRVLLTLLLSALSACNRAGTGEEALVLQGHNLARQYGCVSCHTVDGERSIGPTWTRLYGRQVDLSDGTTVIADEAYLRESILDPSAKTVKGFPEGLMEGTIRPNSVPEKDLRALLAYIKSLR